MFASSSGRLSMPSSKARILPSAAPYDSKRGGVKTGTCRSEDIAAAARVATVPGGDNAARAFNNRHQRGDIIDRQPRIHRDIDEARGEHGKEISISAESRHPRAAAQFVKDPQLLFRTVNFRCHGGENGVADGSGRVYRKLSAV